MHSVRTSEVIHCNTEVVEFGPATVHVRGWIVHSAIPIERVSIRLGDRVLVSDLALSDRLDVKEALRNYPVHDQAHRSGYDIRADLDRLPENTHDALLTIYPFGAGGPMRTVYSPYCDLAYEGAHRPQPPVHLMQRIGGAENYIHAGVSTLGLILTNLGFLGNPAEFERVLDWGCGAGRVTRQLAKCMDPARVYGCDIDPEAIRWAQANLAPSHFATIPPHPPTHYESGFFDAVYGISVMTHLDEPTQLQWLAELRRITRPGAVLLLSVMSGPLREAWMPAALRPEFQRTGFAAYTPGYEKEQGFQEFSEAGYYKESYHSIEYIERVWGRYFSVEEHVRSTAQDLILLRRRSD
jgi:SAM-dependent methyltransferase